MTGVKTIGTITNDTTVTAQQIYQALRILFGPNLRYATVVAMCETDLGFDVRTFTIPLGEIKDNGNLL